MRALVQTLHGTIGKIIEGGSEEAISRHVSLGKLVPRERINTLIDPRLPFLELSQLATYMHLQNFQGGVARLTPKKFFALCATKKKKNAVYWLFCPLIELFEDF